MVIPVFIDVALSLVAIFFILCTSIASLNEVISAFIRGRGRFLRRSISVLLDEEKDSQLMRRLYVSPHIYRDRIFGWLNRKGYLPANISAENFSNALLEEVGKILNGDEMPSLAELEAKVENIPNEHLRNLFRGFVTGTSSTLGLKGVRDNIIRWYNTNMDAVSRLYKLRLKALSFITGLIFCIVLNIDAINYTSFLWTNKNTRDIIVNYAEGLAKGPAPVATIKNPDSVNVVTNLRAMQDSLEKINQFNIPLGWDNAYKDNAFLAKSGQAPNSFFWVLVKIIGIFLSATAISMGAPFWFEVLNKIVGVKKLITKSE